MICDIEISCSRSQHYFVVLIYVKSAVEYSIIPACNNDTPIRPLVGGIIAPQRSAIFPVLHMEMEISECFLEDIFASARR